MKALRIIKVFLRYDIPLWLCGLLTDWLPDNRYTIRIRGMLYGCFIYKCGKNFACARNVQLKGVDHLTIGNDVYLASGVWLNAMGNMVLEDEVVFGPYVVISTGTHTFKNGSVKQGGSLMAPVRVGKGSWLAAHSSVRAGVTIGKGVIVGANSMVTKDVPDNMIVGGVPAKIIGERKDDDNAQIKHSRFDD